jgi:RNA polymerase sigma-70 factor, ECF subfamily
LVRAWSRREACRSPDAPLAWVLEITRNETRRLLGNRARRSAREIVGGEVLAAGDDDHELADTALRLTLQEALLALDDRDRSLLKLRYGEDLTQGEVALRLGMPEGTVKVGLHRARSRLRRLLAD